MDYIILTPNGYLVDFDSLEDEYTVKATINIERAKRMSLEVAFFISRIMCVHGAINSVVKADNALLIWTNYLKNLKNNKVKMDTERTHKKK